MLDWRVWSSGMSGFVAGWVIPNVSMEPTFRLKDSRPNQVYGIETLKRKTRSFETSITTYPVTQGHILETRNRKVIIFQLHLKYIYINAQDVNWYICSVQLGWHPVAVETPGGRWHTLNNKVTYYKHRWTVCLNSFGLKEYRSVFTSPTASCEI